MADKAAATAQGDDRGPWDWSAEEMADAEREATGAWDGEEEAVWGVDEALEAYDEAGVTAEAYLRQDAPQATLRECAGGMTAEQRKLVAERHVLALERRQRR